MTFLDSIRKREISIEEARHKKEEFNRYLKKIRIGNRYEKVKKHWLILISFLTEETMLLNLFMTMVQGFLKTKENQLKKNQNQNQQAKTKRKKSRFELHEKFINEIKNDEKNTYEQRFKEYFFYHPPLFLAKQLYNSIQNVNDEILKHIKDAVIELKKILVEKNS